MRETSALVLLAHGSPDPDWREPIERLGARLRARQSEHLVFVGYMELSPPSLFDIAAQCDGRGVVRATVVPAFLSPGGRHIKRDLPELVRTVAARHPGIAWALVPGALGSDDGVIEALATATLARVKTTSK